MSQMNLGPRDIEAFLAVASHGSFHAAAIALGLSQPAMSSRIRHVEDLLGVKLFHRTTRKVSITDHGERLRIRAEQAMSELGAVVRELRDEARMQRGRVVVGVTATVAAGPTFLPIIQSFKEKWPGVEVMVRDDLRDRTIHMLTSGEIDLAVTVSGTVKRSKPDERIKLDILAHEELLCVANEDHPLFRQKTVTITKAAQYPLLMRPQQTAMWELLSDAYHLAGFTLQAAFVSDNITTLVAMLKAGFGISFMPIGILPMFNMSGLRTKPISPTPLRRPIVLATARGRAIQPNSAALMDAFRVGFASRHSKRYLSP